MSQAVVAAAGCGGAVPDSECGSGLGVAPVPFAAAVCAAAQSQASGRGRRARPRQAQQGGPVLKEVQGQAVEQRNASCFTEPSNEKLPQAERRRDGGVGPFAEACSSSVEALGLFRGRHRLDPGGDDGIFVIGLASSPRDGDQRSHASGDRVADSVVATMVGVSQEVLGGAIPKRGRLICAPAWSE